MAIETQNLQQLVTTAFFLNRIGVQGGMGGYVVGQKFGFVMTHFLGISNQKKDSDIILSGCAWASFCVGTLVKLLQQPVVEKEGSTKSTNYPAKLLLIYLIAKIAIEGGSAYYQLGKQVDKVIKFKDSCWRFKLIFGGLGILFKAAEIYKTGLYSQFKQKWQEEAEERIKQEETDKTAEMTRQKAEEEARKPYRNEEKIAFRNDAQKLERAAKLSLYKSYLEWQGKKIIASWDDDATSSRLSGDNTSA